MEVPEIAIGSFHNLHSIMHVTDMHTISSKLIHYFVNERHKGGTCTDKQHPTIKCVQGSTLI